VRRVLLLRGRHMVRVRVRQLLRHHARVAHAAAGVHDHLLQLLQLGVERGHPAAACPRLLLLPLGPGARAARPPSAG
jgi:hypothetical protein